MVTEWFGERLRRLRTEAGLTQAALAQRAGLSLAGVQQLEYGKRDPAFDTLLALAAALGVGLSAFDPPAEPPPPKRRRPTRRKSGD